MSKRLFEPAFAVLGLLAFTGDGWAQAISQACARLEGQLAAVESQPVPGRDPRMEEAYRQQRAELDRNIARSRGMGCGRNFIFGPRPPAECKGLETQIARMRTQVDRLGAQLQRNRGDDGGREARRRDVMAALAQNQCGPQYQVARPREDRRRQGGLFGLLFGNRGNGRDGGFREAEPEMQARAPQSSTYRTVCVRTCDGFFFPINFSTVPGRFGEDENMCHRTCPGTEAVLFTYPNPGGTMQQATSTTGVPYTEMPNAFKYQTEFVKGCSCKPANMSWAQALAGAEDTSVRSGDIVVDEERARMMSLPPGTDVRSATPAEASRAAQDSASQVTNEGVLEAPADPGQYGGNQYETNPYEPNTRTAVPVYGPPPVYAPPSIYTPPR